MNPIMSKSFSSENSSVLSYSVSRSDSGVAERESFSENGLELSSSSASNAYVISSDPSPISSIGSIAMQDCNQVTFGNQNFFQGSVTVLCDNLDLSSAVEKNAADKDDRLRQWFGELDFTFTGHVNESNDQSCKYYLDGVPRKRRLTIIALISCFILALVTIILLVALLTGSRDIARGKRIVAMSQ